MEMKKVDAKADYTLTVDCPYCEHENDLIQTDEWYYVFGCCETKEGVNEKHECQNCKKEFIIESVYY